MINSENNMLSSSSPPSKSQSNGEGGSWSVKPCVFDKWSVKKLKTVDDKYSANQVIVSYKVQT